MSTGRLDHKPHTESSDKDLVIVEDYEHSTLRSRLLGKNLAEWLEQKCLSRAEVGHRLGLCPVTVDRLLSGRRCDLPDVAGILALCGIRGYDQGKALELAEDPHLRTWCQIRPVNDPSRWHVLSHAEQTAQHVTVYHPLAVPELLQVPDYTRAVLGATPTVWPEIIERLVKHQEKRQAVLHHGSGPSFRFIIHERALAPSLHWRELMVDQVRHLSRVADLANVEVLVVPDTAGVVADHMPFTLYQFNENPSAVCLSHLNSVVVLEESDSVTAYQHTVTYLRDVAMNPDQSRDWLAMTGALLANPAPTGGRGVSGDPHDATPIW